MMKFCRYYKGEEEVLAAVETDLCCGWEGVAEEPQGFYCLGYHLRR